MMQRLLILALLVSCQATEPASIQEASATKLDNPAQVLVNQVLERMGGMQAWENTRYLSWKFFGRRRHHWDRFTGDIRIETGKQLILMNLHTLQGKVFEEGEEILDPVRKDEALKSGFAWWVNDSYWMFMPYKLLDPGVNLEYLGYGKLEDGRQAQVISVTFRDVGLTPGNRYDVFVAENTGLIEQWSFYRNAGDEKPAFILPWEGWQRFGNLLLATSHGRGKDWEISVPESLPKALFERP